MSKIGNLMKKFDYPSITTGLMSSEVKQCALISTKETIKALQEARRDIYFDGDQGALDAFAKYINKHKEIVVELNKQL
jgi:hypothetical protein